LNNNYNLNPSPKPDPNPNPSSNLNPNPNIQGEDRREKEEVRPIGSKGPPQHRTIALRTTSASGRVESILTAGLVSNKNSNQNQIREKKLKNDQFEAMREIQMQNKQLQSTEQQICNLCNILGIDSMEFLDDIYSKLIT
jgi:hypothetical protein